MKDTDAEAKEKARESKRKQEKDLHVLTISSVHRLWTLSPLLVTSLPPGHPPLS
jgi:hypothetical protein